LSAVDDPHGPRARAADQGLQAASSEAIEAVARVAHALVHVESLPELGGDALTQISVALELDASAIFLADPVDGVIRRVESWRSNGSRVAVAPEIPLDRDASDFLLRSGGPLVFRGSEGRVIDNPFDPCPSSWLVLPLVLDGRVAGALVGCAARPMTLDRVAISTLSAVGDLLSAGVATARLRTEVQRTRIQRERMRIASDLHEGLAQDLALAVREIAFLDGDPTEDAARASWERLREAVTSAHRVVRGGLLDLARHAPTTDVRAAVEEVCERFRRRGLAVDVTGPRGTGEVDPGVLGVVIGVLNEALANTLRHAGVDTARVELTMSDGWLRMTITDAGRGIHASPSDAGDGGHFGLEMIGARARAAGGEVVLRSPSGGGVSVELLVPLDRRA
jgi:signal transduction histidine kinase